MSWTRLTVKKRKKIIFRKAGWFFKIWEQFWNDHSKTTHTTALAGDWWLVQKSHASFSTNERQNQSHLVCAIFPALWTSYSKLLGILIGSLCCLLFLWLVNVITFLLVFQSLENRSIIFTITITWLWSYKTYLFTHLKKGKIGRVKFLDEKSFLLRVGIISINGL